MQSIILAAGLSSRFGGNPKHLLPGKTEPTVVQEISKTLPEPQLVVVGMNTHMQGEKPLDGIFSTIPVESKGSPLADLMQVEGIDPGVPVLVNYCDCWVPGGVDTFIKRVSEFEAGVVVFPSNNPRHDQLAEGMCFGGVFWFSSWGALKMAANEVGGAGLVLDAVKQLKYAIHMAPQYIDIGVPEDYERWING